ncbi:SEC-C metal-binding domain-containing protein [uncultured Agrobacterium sp.]|uniref:SEC-C metal-binding domain-containing protein n=1 Tax=uncultured Agrobacterium sp. TaxID=157277 RepID=UPI003445E9FF
MRVRRNDLCPCGSNTKAKKCCLRSDSSLFLARKAQKEGDPSVRHHSCYLNDLGGALQH